MTAAYPFRSGSPVDRVKLQVAVDAAYDAAKNLAQALVMDGVSDWRRDEHLDAAAILLDEATGALDGTRRPEPPKVSPFSRAEMVDVLFDIATPPGMRAVG